MTRFFYVICFWDFLHLCFIGIKSIEKKIEENIKDIKRFESIKIDKILKKTCINKSFWYLELLHILNKILSTFLSKFLSFSIIEL